MEHTNMATPRAHQIYDNAARIGQLEALNAELLAALKRITDASEHADGVSRADVIISRAAIAKAEGR